MSDYVLSFTLAGESVTQPFDRLAWAQAAFDGLVTNPDCTRATITGMGYELDRFVRDSQTNCEARSRVLAFDVSGNAIGYEECAHCGGTGIARHLLWDRHSEPVEAGSIPCPECYPAPEAVWPASSEVDVSEVWF